ncbi:DExH-box splicing factor binding site-domain-containing protein [Mrakia frigida]|uniref:DExH-box splicing factor binding site-domain-containing protein n=1 Tax=Mrakia frigida TaxID=29902 RepID=UPI003FCC173F
MASSSSQPPAGLSFRIQNPTPSPVSSAPASPAESTSGASSPRAPAFKVPHKPVRPSPLAAAQRKSGGGFVKHEEDDSSDEESKRMGGNGEEEEEVGWDLDSKGKGTYVTKKGSPPPFVIAPLANKDWRNSSRSTKAQTTPYLPLGAQQSQSTEPIVTIEVNTGGGGGRGGLIRSVKTEEGEVSSSTAPKQEDAEEGGETVPKKEETLDERAMRALLAGANGEDSDGDGGDIEAIQSMENKRQMPISEEEAFRRDVDSRPDESNASDYARVPVANFGLALLKGMGWKEGQAASKHRKGLEQAYVPKARPALLGIGATERAVPELGKGEKAKPKWKVKEEAKKYVPIMKVDRNGGGSGSGTPTALSRPGTPSSSSTPNRRTSRSASPPRRRREDDREPSSSSSSRRDEREPSSSSSRYRERDDRESSSSSRRDRDDRDRRDRDSRPRERSRSREREREDRDRRRRRDEESGGGRSSSRREEETEDERRERKRREKERDGGGERDRDRERRRDDERRR